MKAAESEINPLTSSSVLLIIGITILSGLFITTLAVNHELYDPLHTGKMIFKIITWTGWFVFVLILMIIPSIQSRAIYLGTLIGLVTWTFFRYKPSEKLITGYGFNTVQLTLALLQDAYFTTEKGSNHFKTARLGMVSDIKKHCRLKPIIMTRATTMIAMIPLLFEEDMRSRLQQPQAIEVIGSIFIGL